MTGVFNAHPRGFGFVEVEGREEDVFIAEENVGGALHQDTVQVLLLPASTGKRQEGRILRILEHGIHEVIGTYQKSRTYGFVLPDNPRITTDIFVPQEHSMGAVQGHKVLVELTSYGDEKHKPEGRVKEIIGHINDPGTDILSVVYQYELPNEFPEKVMRQAEKTPQEVHPADMEGRLDLRDVQMVTIDGEDAKDLDDAVSLTVDENGYHLGVHIADVANYVQEKSALDREAYVRGTSVYLADRVIPMLPHRLSNGICSLNAGVDRLAMSCLMDIDEKGKYCITSDCRDCDPGQPADVLYRSKENSGRSGRRIACSVREQLHRCWMRCGRSRLCFGKNGKNVVRLTLISRRQR